MTKYILIQNDGEIETNSFELIGASTKRGETGKIGFFGSGLKYSIAYMMRKQIGFKIFSGEKELLFTTHPEQLKDKSFERIMINGNPTSYTTTMGPTWTEDWFVLREIYCNAIDEGTCTLVKETEIVSPSEGKTRIYIEQTDTLRNVCNNWDAYFSDERTPIFTTDKDVYTCNLGTEDNNVYNQKVSVYHKTNGAMYRKGIRVYQNEKYLYDYGFSNININEDRTAKNANSINYAILNMAAAFQNENYIKSILRTGADDLSSTEYYALSYSDPTDAWSDKWVEFSKTNLLVVKELSSKYTDEIRVSKKEVFVIPATFARYMKKNLPEVLIMGMGSLIGNSIVNEIEATAKMNFLLKEVIAALKEMKYEVHFDIKVVSFDDENILGQADLKNKVILIADKTFDMGRREIAMTLMEENEHILSQKEDETRAFQTHIFSQWLKTMEDSNGLFL